MIYLTAFTLIVWALSLYFQADKKRKDWTFILLDLMMVLFYSDRFSEELYKLL